MDSVAHAELGQDPGHMRLDRRLAKGQRGGDFGVAHAACDQSQRTSLRGVTLDGGVALLREMRSASRVRALGFG